MKSFGYVFFLLGLFSHAVASAVAEDRIQEHVFEVLLDDKPIGLHEFLVRDSGSERRISIEASFDVRVLFVPVYSYRHSNAELWRDGCLQRIESETDSNGKPYRVSGEVIGREFALSTQVGDRVYPGACLMTFAYWDRQMLQQDSLLNAQTGDLVDVEIQPLGRRLLELRDVRVEADAFRITSPMDGGIDIRLFYEAATGRWLSLESKLESGRTMRYLPVGASGIVMAGRSSSASEDGGAGQ
jgi:hypothetical protein